MSISQKRKVWEQINGGADVKIWFTPIQTFNIDFDGDMELPGGGHAMLPRDWLADLVAGNGIEFTADSEWGVDEERWFESDGESWNFGPTDSFIHAVKISKPGTSRHLRLASIDETMILDSKSSDHISIGCRTLMKEDAEKAAIAIFEWLGYEVG